MTDSKDWFDVRSVPTEKEARGPVTERVEIDTREGTVVAEPGDYVMREADGSVYPIAPEKFEEYYEVIEEQTETDDRETWDDCPECGAEIDESHRQRLDTPWVIYCPFCGEYLGPAHYPRDFGVGTTDTTDDTGRDWLGLARHYAESLAMYALLGISVLNFIAVVKAAWEWQNECR